MVLPILFYTYAESSLLLLGLMSPSRDDLRQCSQMFEAGIISLGDLRQVIPALIAVSSFGEGLRRVFPPHRPGGGAI
jgi:hypothetical protein